MKLMDAAIFSTLPKLNTNGGENPTVHLKYTSPDSAMQWYVTEGQVLNNQYIFWGIVVGPDSRSYAYFDLQDLEKLVGPDGESVVREESFIPRPMNEIVEFMDLKDQTK